MEFIYMFIVFSLHIEMHMHYRVVWTDSKINCDYQDCTLFESTGVCCIYTQEYAAKIPRQYK